MDRERKQHKHPFEIVTRKLNPQSFIYDVYIRSFDLPLWRTRSRKELERRKEVQRQEGKRRFPAGHATPTIQIIIRELLGMI